MSHLRVTHAVYKGLLAVTGPHIVKLASVPNRLNEQLRKDDGMGRRAGSVSSGVLDMALKKKT